MNVKEYAALHNKKTTFIYRLIKQGRLKARSVCVKRGYDIAEGTPLPAMMKRGRPRTKEVSA